MVYGKAEIDLDAVNQVLDKVGDRPVSIISVVGIRRIGKSFLLGYFLRKLNNKGGENWFESKLTKQFHWREGSEQDTTGILWWSEPFYININGVKTAILLMDTQGIFDDKITIHENAYIFALSTLLSSTMIYYTRNDITEELLQQLQFFASYSRIYNTNTYNLSELVDSEEPFQNLVILIRDWSFEEYNYGNHDDQNPPYKNAKINLINPSPESPREVQIVHRSFLECFSNVSLYLLPYAGKKLALKGDTSEMYPDFVEYYKGFVTRMLNSTNIQTKKIGRDLLTGTSLKKYVAKLRNIFLSAEVPKARNISDVMTEQQNTMAVQIAIKGYEQMVRDSMTENGLYDHDFEELHKKASEDSSNVFMNVKKLGNNDVREKFKEILNENLELLYEKYKAINDANIEHYKTKEKLNQEIKLRKLTNDEVEQRLKQLEKDKNIYIKKIKQRSKPSIFQLISGITTI